MKTNSLRLLLLFALAIGVPAALNAQSDEPVRVDQIQWVDPPDSLPTGVSHQIFHSTSMDREVGYSIYLPTGYEDSEQTYPVIYWLHGRSGSESDTRPAVALHKAIEDGAAQPMILVLANGGVASGYIDNPETGVMGESVILADLIPHVESRYRVSARAGGRGLSGFSMGGGGAVRMVVRNPRMFGSVVSIGGVLVGFREIMERNFVVDEELARRYDPYPNSIDAAPRLRAVSLMVLVGSEDSWIAENRRFAAHLQHQNLTIEYRELRGIEHDLGDYLTVAGNDLFRFHSANLSAGP